MALFEAAIPKKHRAKFVRAVAARRALNELYRREKPPTDAQIHAKTRADYVAMNALPLLYQGLAAKRAGR